MSRYKMVWGPKISSTNAGEKKTPRKRFLSSLYNSGERNNKCCVHNINKRSYFITAPSGEPQTFNTKCSRAHMTLSKR